ncbi:Uncharacterised protein [Salmonella enterica subsp. arizonae]|uniref:Uncharacterized protein n=1 Tax=Salmonella enterica subsp. arizonae TaxID=59203 RepID=A0A447R0Y0_SALER|nr:Uncharacterised protein [Salmonella enterica subsp. arizonae]
MSRVVEGFTSDSFGIGFGLFLERFVGRYLQFSQIMSVILLRCLLMLPYHPISLSIPEPVALRLTT